MLSFTNASVAASLALYAVACALPALVGERVRDTGLTCLVMGWTTLLAIVSDPLWFLAWLANPLYFAALALFVWRPASRLGLVLGLAAVALSLTALAIRSVLPNEAQDAVPVALASGVYLWIAAIALPVAVALLRRL